MVGVARQIGATAELKRRHPGFGICGLGVHLPAGLATAMSLRRLSAKAGSIPSDSDEWSCPILIYLPTCCRAR